MPAYAAAKGALGQVTKALSNEWSKENVQVNGIVPGYIATDMYVPFPSDKILPSSFCLSVTGCATMFFLKLLLSMRVEIRATSAVWSVIRGHGLTLADTSVERSSLRAASCLHGDDFYGLWIALPIHAARTS